MTGARQESPQLTTELQMSLKEKKPTSRARRWLHWVSNGVWGIILAVLFCAIWFFVAAGQIPLGPQFKIATVGAPVAGIAVPVAIALMSRLLHERWPKHEFKENGRKFRFRRLSRREWIAGAAIVAITIVGCWASLKALEVWTNIRDERIASRAEMARQEFEVFFYGDRFKRTQVNQTLAELLEAYEHLGRELPKQIREDPFSVHLFRNLQEYRAISATPGAFGSVLCNATGTLLAIPLEGIPDLLSEDESRTPVHEMVHALMCQALGPEATHSISRWFHEGMAQLYEGDGPGKFDRTVNRIMVWFKRNDLMAAHPFCSASTWVSQAEMKLFYGISMEFVRTLESQHGRDKLIAVIQAVQEGEPFDESLQEYFGGSCDELYERWLASW